MKLFICTNPYDKGDMFFLCTSHGTEALLLMYSIHLRQSHFSPLGKKLHFPTDSLSKRVKNFVIDWNR